jgi:hypothetical protein
VIISDLFMAEHSQYPQRPQAIAFHPVFLRIGPIFTAATRTSADRARPYAGNQGTKRSASGGPLRRCRASSAGLVWISSTEPALELVVEDTLRHPEVLRCRELPRSDM